MYGPPPLMLFAVYLTAMYLAKDWVGELSESSLANRGGALASRPGGPNGNGVSAFGWIGQSDARTAPAGTIRHSECGFGSNPKMSADGLWERRSVGSQETDFPTCLEIQQGKRGIPTFPQRRRRLLL
jgi:hypothetical protein